MEDKLIKISNVYKNYTGGYNALNNINMEIGYGERICLLGNEGSGKTSLLLLLTKLEKVSSGQIIYKGADLYKIPFKELDIAYISDLPNLFYNRSIDYNIGYPLKIRGMSKDNISVTVKKAKANYGLEYIHKLPNKRNHFESMKIALARASVTEHRLFMIDNPYIGLNYEEIHNLNSYIDNLVGNNTLIITTDNIANVSSLNIEKYGVLSYATLADYGSLTDLRTTPSTVETELATKGKKVNLLDIAIEGNDITIFGKKFRYNNEIIHNIFKEGIIAIDYNDVIIDNNGIPSKVLDYNSEEKELIAEACGVVLILKIHNNRYKSGDELKISFNIDKQPIYDKSSERRICK